MGTWERGNGQESKPAQGRGANRFEELEVWQTARRLATGVYRACRTQKLADDRSLSNQMRRAAVSIGSNIAEGYERGTRKQHIEFCYYAKGSAGELRSQVITAHDVALIDDVACAWLMEMCDKCSRQLAAYIAHLQRSQSRIKGMKHAATRDQEARTAVPTFPRSHVSLPAVPTSPPPHVPAQRK